MIDEVELLLLEGVKVFIVDIEGMMMFIGFVKV